MNRREALVSISAITGHALFRGVLDAFARAHARAASPPAAWQPELLSSALGEVLAEVVETILPETDTPGAKAAKVHVFVDLTAKACLLPAEQRTLIAGLEELGGGFVALGQAEREARLQRIDAATFKLLKDLTLLGYFTSEIGCTRALAYEAAPGRYRGCIPLEPGQKAWATR